MATIIVKKLFVLNTPVTTTQKRVLERDGRPVADAAGNPVYVEEVTAVSAKPTWFRQTGTIEVPDEIANHPYILAGADGRVALPGEVPVQVVAPPPPATAEEARKRAEELLALADQLEEQQAAPGQPRRSCGARGGPQHSGEPTAEVRPYRRDGRCG